MVNAEDAYVDHDVFVKVSLRMLPLSRWTTVSTDEGFMNHLLNLFFTWDNVVERLFYRPIFEENLVGLDPDSANDDPGAFCSRFLVNALLAVSCVSCTPSRILGRCSLIQLVSCTLWTQRASKIPKTLRVEAGGGQTKPMFIWLRCTDHRFLCSKVCSRCSAMKERLEVVADPSNITYEPWTPTRPWLTWTTYNGGMLIRHDFCESNRLRLGACGDSIAANRTFPNSCFPDPY